MLPYWLVFIILVLVSFLSITTKINKSLLANLIYLTLIILIGFRDQTGSDWNHYKNFFDDLKFSGEKAYNFEAGFVFYSEFLHYIRDDYAMFLFASSALYLFIFTKSIHIKATTAFTLLGLYSSHLLPLMGQSRQVIAVSLCALGSNYLIKSNIKFFIILVIAASAFHKSALIFLLAYFLLDFKFQKKHLYYTALIIATYYILTSELLLLIEYIAGNLPVIGSQLIAYVVSDNNTPIFYVDDSSTLAFLYGKRISFALFFVLVGGHIYKYKREYLFYSNIYVFSTIVFLLFYSVFPAIAIRLSLYFYIYDAFIFSIILLNLRNKYKIIVFVGFVLIFALRLWQPLSQEADFLVPYKGIFFNTDVPNKDMPG